MNGYLLDTNVPSEFSRDRPEPRVVKWLKAQPVTTLFLSVIAIGEICRFTESKPAAGSQSYAVLSDLTGVPKPRTFRAWN